MALALLIIWLLGLIPWFFMAPLSFMSFDAGVTTQSTIFVVFICTYPIPVIIAAIAYRWWKWGVLLPLINFTGILVAIAWPAR